MHFVILLRLTQIVMVAALLGACQMTRAEKRKARFIQVKVRKGESLSEIAERFQTQWKSLARYNRLRDPHHLKPGQVLRIRIRDEADPLQLTEKANEKLQVDEGFLFDDGGKVIWPVAGRVSSEFGRRGRRQHEGIDIAGKLGSPIFAAEKGEVEFVGWRRGYGRMVVLKHKSFKTVYAHCRRLLVHKGEWVRQGQVIAHMGASGNAKGVHLHFEWRSLQGVALNPRDLLPASSGGSVLVGVD